MLVNKTEIKVTFNPNVIALTIKSELNSLLLFYTRKSDHNNPF